MFIQILPEELVLEILSCLPVKALLRLRCVCREWCNLIDGKHFVTKHLTRSTQNKMNRYLIVGDHEKSCLYSVQLESLNYTVKLDISSWWPKDHGVVVRNSCNGLLCLSSDREFWKYAALWNPSINKHLFLPSSIFEHLGLHVPGDYIYRRITFHLRLGFDSTSNDYKVVSILQYFPHEKSGIITEVNVYSLRLSSWRRVDGITKGLGIKGPGNVLIKNSLHWPANREPENSNCYRSIVAFDLSREEIQEIPIPRITKGSISEVKCMGIQVIEGLLSVGFSHKKGRFDLWIMEDYGISDSWTKMISIHDPNIFAYKGSREILYVKNKGLLLVAYSLSMKMKILWHDSETKAFKEVHVPGLPEVYRASWTLALESPCPSEWWH